MADDLLKNDGKKFIEMMEQLAERRMAREEDAKEQFVNGYGHPQSGMPLHNHSHGHNHPPVPEDEEEYDSQEDDEEYDDEDEDYEEEDMVSIPYLPPTLILNKAGHDRGTTHGRGPTHVSDFRC